MDNIAALGWRFEEKKTENKIQQQFRKAMQRNNKEIRFYCGRYFYKGWATTVDDFNGIQDVIRMTKVKLQWDNLGLGYIIYPER